MIRADRLGVIDYLVKVSHKENRVSTKIICPLSKDNFGIVKRVTEQAPDIGVLNGNDSLYGMYIIDGEKLLRVEMRDPNAETFMEAIGFAVYSNRKNTVESFKSVFELLWNERVLNEELKKTYERQNEFIKMQKEFINVAAHDLRTPIQPILGLSDFLLSKKGDIEQHKELLYAIKRGAKRLHALTEDILDVTRIESQSLDLKKEQFNLNDILTNTINDTLINSNFLKNKEKNVKLLYQPQDIFVVADREGLS
jgi:two-component system sensor histidine kinase VicK